MFRHNGGIQLTMPHHDGKPLVKDKQSVLYEHFLKSVLTILKGEQQCLGVGGKEESEALASQLATYAYNKEPFRSQPWNAQTKPLNYWKSLEKDSNAWQLAVSLLTS